MKELTERLEKERLSDNTQMDYCAQCKECIHWGKSGTPWDNKYNKSNCEEYPYPQSMKPVGVINNEIPCPMREVT